MLNRARFLTGVIYGVVSLYSPQRQNTTMYVGSEHGLKVWLNGVLIRENRGRHGNDYSDFFPVTLRQGRNVLVSLRLSPVLIGMLTPFSDLNQALNIRWGQV